MSSDRRVTSSRANGAKSRGPVTPQGKLRSSQNALNYDTFARCVLAAGESPENVGELRQAYEDRFQPTGYAEQCAVDLMCACDWRLARVLNMETEALNKQLADNPNKLTLYPFAEALEAVAALPATAMLQRYEARLQLFQRAIRTLKLLRTLPPPKRDDHPAEAARNQTNPVP